MPGKEFIGIFRWGDFGYSGLIGKEFSSQVLCQYDYVMLAPVFFTDQL